jgi:hypothetical protein
MPSDVSDVETNFFVQASPQLSGLRSNKETAAFVILVSTRAGFYLPPAYSLLSVALFDGTYVRTTETILRKHLEPHNCIHVDCAMLSSCCS